MLAKADEAVPEYQSIESDAIVAGGGPAGVLTAILLARRNHSVVLLTGGRSRPRIEGLSQRVLDALRAQGLEAAASAVGPEVERLAVWNGERSARNREHVTERTAFDAALLRDAAAAGVRVIKVRRLARGHRAGGIEARAVALEGDALLLRGRFLVEARGRSAPSARARELRGPETTALVRRIDGFGGQRCTAVESFADGWAWFVADGESAYLQIFLDSGAGLPKRGALTALFDAQVESLDLIPELIAAGRSVGPVMTRGASARLADDLFGPASLRVGDAAAAVDPLSGHGLFEALGSALAASAVVHTLLSRPANGELARRFYRERVEGAFWRYARVGRDFYALERRWPARPFWSARAEWPDQAAAHAPPDAAPPRIETRPVIEAGFVVARRVVVTADQPRGIWRIAEVPLAELLDLLRASRGDPLEARRAELARRLAVAEDQLDTALDWLRARWLLVADEKIALREEMLAPTTG